MTILRFGKKSEWKPFFPNGRAGPVPSKKEVFFISGTLYLQRPCRDSVDNIDSYLASVADSMKDIDQVCGRLSAIAREFSMVVLMCNYVGTGSALQSLADGGILINGDEVRPRDDTAYLSELRAWADYMRRLIADGRVPDSMHETMNGWIRRNVDCFGQLKQSGDDCHETVKAQLSYLTDVGFANADILWQKDLWSVFRGKKQ